MAILPSDVRRRLPRPAAAVLAGTLVVLWGMCPCAMGRLVRSLLGDAPSAATARACPPCCCGERGEAPCPREDGPRAPVPGDCPHCAQAGCHGGLTAPDAMPSLDDVASLVAVAPPSPAALFGDAVRARPRLLSGGSSGPPPESGVETVVLRC
jgi:hypothetical protein